MREESPRSSDTVTPVPAEGEVSALARHRDPSLSEKAGQMTKPQRGVAWVRPSELMTQAGGRVAGRGIDFEAELARRARRAPATAIRAGRRGIETVWQATSARARRLPPVSEFGRPARTHSWVTRSGIGLG
jgi:hypothetical protein